LLKTSEKAGPLARIVINDVHKDFTLRHTHSFKETALAAIRRRPLATRFHALDGVTVEIGEGEAVALLGFNGSGKSTTLKMISGVLRPDTGSVRTRGRVAGLIEVGAGFHPDLSGRENIYLNAAILGMSRKETEARFDEIVAFSEIGRFIDTEVKHYSSGMFLRLAFAVAIHTEVDILLIDEILSVGDEPFQRKCLARIRQLHAAGKTLVVVSHDLNMVSKLCDRGVVLHQGRVVFDGPSVDAVAAMRALSPSPFTDVERDHPYFREIVGAADSRLMPPYPTSGGRSEFRPDEPVSLGTLARALAETVRVAGEGSSPAADSPVDERTALERLHTTHPQIGRLAGRDASAVATRSDAARLLYLMAGEPTVGRGIPFGDVGQDDPDGPAMTWLFHTDVARGWDEPFGPPTYRPQQPITRAQLIIMLARFRDRSPSS
jgi:ABC-2 type transport system ATP-binding protein